MPYYCIWQRLAISSPLYRARETRDTVRYTVLIVCCTTNLGPRIIKYVPARVHSYTRGTSPVPRVPDVLPARTAVRSTSQRPQPDRTLAKATPLAAAVPLAADWTTCCNLPRAYQDHRLPQDPEDPAPV